MKLNLANIDGYYERIKQLNREGRKNSPSDLRARRDCSEDVRDQPKVLHVAEDDCISLDFGSHHQYNQSIVEEANESAEKEGTPDKKKNGNIFRRSQRALKSFFTNDEKEKKQEKKAPEKKMPSR